MMYDLAKPEHLKKLVESANHSYQGLKETREFRAEAVAVYAGKNYANNRGREADHMNLLEFAINTFLRHLVAQNPQVLLTTRVEKLKPSASMFELALNQLIRDINLRATLRDATLNAMFSLGVIKTALSEDVRHELEDTTHVVGRPFADSIDLEDLFLDTKAKRLTAQRYVGHSYQLPYEQVMDSNVFDKDAKNRLYGAIRDKFMTGETSVRDMLDYNQGGDPDKEDDQLLSLVELYLPYDGKVCTFLCDSAKKIKIGEPLRVDDWNGPRMGPYHYLGFIDVPGMLLPNSPASLYLDPHKYINQQCRKLIRQAAIQKSVFTAQHEHAEDLETVANSEDGAAFTLDNPDSVKVNEYGGVDERSLGFLLQMRQNFSDMAGNLFTLGGVAPSSNTVGQEQLLQQSSSLKVEEMQDRVTHFTTSVCSALGEFLYETPGLSVDVEREFQVSGSSVFRESVSWPNPDSEIYPADLREGPFESYDISVQPYSMTAMSPGERVAALDDTLINTLMPSAEIMAQQGLSLDFRKYLKTKSAYLGMPELEDIIIDQSGQLQQGPEDQESSSPPPRGQRSVEHRYNGVQNQQAEVDEQVKGLIKG